MTQRPLAGRTALVTGGGRGIGAATARALAARGADVVITYRADQASAAEVVRDCRDRHGVRADALAFDLTASDAAAELIERFGPLTPRADIVVVNAAAGYPHQPLTELTAHDLAAKVSADLSCLHQLVAHFMPRMLANGYGRVVVVGSMHAYGPSAPAMTANGVTKAALAGYVPYAVQELTGPGVTINTVHPSFVPTELTTALPAAIPPLMAQLTPSGRAGTPQDIAAAVAMLAAEEAEFINGVEVPVTGGLNHPLPLDRVLATRAAPAT